MKIKSLALFTILSLFVTSVSLAASIDKAGMLNQHGLTKEAKAELIDVIFSKAGNASKAQAYHLNK